MNIISDVLKKIVPVNINKADLNVSTSPSSSTSSESDVGFDNGSNQPAVINEPLSRKSVLREFDPLYSSPVTLISRALSKCRLDSDGSPLTVKEEIITNSTDAGLIEECPSVISSDAINKSDTETTEQIIIIESVNSDNETELNSTKTEENILNKTLPVITDETEEIITNSTDAGLIEKCPSVISSDAINKSDTKTTEQIIIIESVNSDNETELNSTQTEENILNKTLPVITDETEEIITNSTDAGLIEECPSVISSDAINKSDTETTEQIIIKSDIILNSDNETKLNSTKTEENILNKTFPVITDETAGPKENSSLDISLTTNELDIKSVVPIVQQSFNIIEVTEEFDSAAPVDDKLLIKDSVIILNLNNKIETEIANSDNITTEITNLNKTLPVTTSPKEVPGPKEDHDSIPSEIPASENVLLTTDIEPQSVKLLDNDVLIQEQPEVTGSHESENTNNTERIELNGLEVNSADANFPDLINKSNNNTDKIEIEQQIKLPETVTVGSNEALVNSTSPLRTEEISLNNNNNTEPIIIIAGGEETVSSNETTVLIKDIISNSDSPKLSVAIQTVDKMSEHHENVMLQLDAAQQRIADLENKLKDRDVLVVENQKLKDELSETIKEFKEISMKLDGKIEENTRLKSLANVNVPDVKSNDDDDDDVATIKEENILLKGHLSSLEIAFNDIHKKYERCKIIIDGYKANEDVLKGNNQLLEDGLKKETARYETLKSYAKSQMEKGNRENLQLKTSFESKIKQLNTVVKRLEIKCVALQENLNQKCKECSELSALCDEYTGKRS